MRRSWALFALLTLSCSSSEAPAPAPSGSGAAIALFDLSADFTKDTAFFDFPYPSDLRLSAEGTPIASAFPNPLGKTLVNSVVSRAGDRKGFPVLPTGYFRFGAAVGKRSPNDTIAADASSPVLLVDVDDSSPDNGKLIPTVVSTLSTDDYVPEHVLGVAPRPGFVLHGKRKYAFVIRKSLNDANGKPLDVPAPFAELAAGRAPSGARGEQAKALYAPLWTALAKLGVPATDVASATVFTTGDVVADFAVLSDAVLAQYDGAISELTVDADDGALHPRYCELKGKITLPQFQKGTPPFDKEGFFEMEGALPKKQRDEAIPFTISFPKQAMPKGGYPLVMYFHGSGGLSTASVDRGRWHLETDPTKCPEGKLGEWEKKTGCNVKGEGPAHVVAAHGMGMAGSALPVNPERVIGASEIEYINLANLAVMRDTFRQGAIEQRLFIKALKALRVKPELVSACTGMSLPADEPEYRYRSDMVLAMGQSMGGMYANIIAGVEPSIKAVAPTGAGGYWSYFITKTSLYDDGAGLVAQLISASPELDFMHPVLTTFETAVEVADPFVYMPRLARRPLPNHPTRPIYEPVGKGDSYFPIALYDAVALAYGHPQAGDVVWPSMQDVLELAGLDKLIGYPVTQNLKSESGTPYTGVVVQYEGDGLYDPHAIYTQRDEVQYQYGCFFKSFVDKGVATVPKPAPFDVACP